MISTPASREELLLKLVRIPSVTCSAAENDAAVFVHGHLSGLDYFRENPSHLLMVPTPLEGDMRPLHTVTARIMARKSTGKTAVLIAHYDVVDVGVYEELRPWAFEPDELAKRLAAGELDDRVRRDLASGDFIFGRGTMDMKCGLAVAMELLRDYDHDRDLFDINIILLAVPDEENTACGMRGAAKYLAELQREEGLEYLAGIDIEPSEPGLPDARNQLIFMGTLGKLLPTFYCRGLAAHVGNYYHGLSAALLSSRIVCSAEGAPELADPHNGACQPSWICLNHRILTEGYSVTVPERALAYFNCFATTKTPAIVMEEMRAIAEKAAEQTIAQLRASHTAIAEMGYAPEMNENLSVRVVSFGEIFDMAAALYGGGADALSGHVSDFLADLPAGDMRDRGVGVLEELIRLSGIEPPFIAVGFLPPYNPQKTSLDGKPGSDALVRVAGRVVGEARDRFGVAVDIVELFAGLSDMSYLGFGGSMDDVRPLMENCPGWGDLFSVPIEEMMQIDMPVMNLGPCGYDAHRKTERVDRKYSLDVLPELLVFALKALSEEHEEQ